MLQWIDNTPVAHQRGQRHLCKNCEFEFSGTRNYQSLLWQCCTGRQRPARDRRCPLDRKAKASLQTRRPGWDVGGKHKKRKRCLDPATRLDLLAKITDQVLTIGVTTGGSSQQRRIMYVATLRLGLLTAYLGGS